MVRTNAWLSIVRGLRSGSRQRSGPSHSFASIDKARADLPPCAHHSDLFGRTCIREPGIVDVVRQFPDGAGWQIALQRLTEHPIGFRLGPHTPLIAGKVKSLAVNKLAHAAARNEHADRAFGGTQPFAEQTTETGEFFGIRPHPQYLDDILVEVALPEFLGHLSHPPVGEVETPRHHYLRQAGSTGSSEPCLARTVDATGDKVGELGCREIDHAGKFARCRQHLERAAAWPRGMKMNDLKSFRLQSLC